MSVTPAQPRSILIVEDEALLRATIQLALQGAGHSVTCAENGKQAKRLLACTPFDLIITDLLMPECDGLEVLAATKKLSSPPPTIMISGGGVASAEYYFKVAKVLGAHSVLQKPFTIAALKATVGLALAS